MGTGGYASDPDAGGDSYSSIALEVTTEHYTEDALLREEYLTEFERRVKDPQMQIRTEAFNPGFDQWHLELPLDPWDLVP